MGRTVIVASLLLLALGWAAWSIRAASATRVLGHPPENAPLTSVAAIRRDPQRFVGKMVSLSGHITQRCPTAGCWFYLNDGTGDLRVDAGAGGFSVLTLPLGARLTVFGAVLQDPGEDPQLAAVGARS